MSDTDPPLTPSAIRRRRLTYRANHRGSYECDLLLGGFVNRNLAAMTDAELDALEEILELVDSDLAEWLTGREPIPDHMSTPLLLRIRDAAGR